MRVLWISVVIIVIDQVTKWLAFTRLRPRNDSVRLLGDWFKFTYTENPGMAFGVEFGFGPPFLVTLFSVVATIVIVIYLYSVRMGYKPYRTSLALVMGGAIGNIIDRMFYGVLLQGNPLFQGRVVDFLHIDVWRGMWPEWVPFFGGSGVAFFPIGNVADLAIIAGVVGILLFQKKFHDQMLSGFEGAPADAESTEVPTDLSLQSVSGAGPEEAVSDQAATLEAKSIETSQPKAADDDHHGSSPV